MLSVFNQKNVELREKEFSRSRICMKQSLNNFILVLMKASTVLGMLKFAQDSFPELKIIRIYHKLAETRDSMSPNESQGVKAHDF